MEKTSKDDETMMKEMIGKKTKGRQKILIKKIENKNKLQVTFSMRCTGLFNKAAELSILCGADVCVFVQSPANLKVYGFGRPSAASIISRFEQELSDIESGVGQQGANDEDEIDKEQSAAGKTGSRWFEEVNIDELGSEGEVTEYFDALEALQKNVLSQADDIAAANSSTTTTASGAAGTDSIPEKKFKTIDLNLDYRELMMEYYRELGLDDELD